MEPASPAPAPAGPENDQTSSRTPEPAAPSHASRGGRSPRDMVMSLAVLLVPIAILLVIYRTLLSGDAPVVIDPAPSIQQAQQAALFPVSESQGLGDQWRPLSAKFVRAENGATLRIGYVDPDEDPVQVIQSSVPAAALLPVELTKEAKPQEDIRTAAGVWRLYTTRPGEGALVLTEANRTVIVIGKTDVDNLRTMAESLTR